MATGALRPLGCKGYVCNFLFKFFRILCTANVNCFLQHLPVLHSAVGCR